MSLNAFQYIPAPMAHDTFSHACYDCNSSSTSTSSATSSPFSSSSSLSPTFFTVPQQLGMTQGPPPHSPVATPPTFISVQVPHSSATREITMEQVMNEFNNSVEEAANNLLLNVSELRRISRVFGITRWPYKTKQSLEQRSNSFDFKVDMSAAASPKQQRRRNQPQYKHTTTLTQEQTPHQACNKEVAAIASLSKQKKGIRKSSKMAELQHCNRKTSGVACAAAAKTLPTATSNIAQPTTWYNTKIRPKSSSSSKRTSKKSLVQQQEEQQKPMPVSQIQCQQQQQQQDCPMLPSFDQLMQSLAAAAVMND